MQCSSKSASHTGQGLTFGDLFFTNAKMSIFTRLRVVQKNDWVAKPLFILKLDKGDIVKTIICLSILYKFEITLPYTYQSKMTDQKIERIISILLKYEHKLSDGYQYYSYEEDVLREIAQTILAAIDTAAELKLDEKDIELVMGQTIVSREHAIDALKKNKGDIVEAIMYLSP